jgi:alpha-tubulin suppressor-like RCC1 family protein
MGSVSLGGRILWAGLVVLAGCQSDGMMAPVAVAPAASVGEFLGLASGGRHACVPQITNFSTGASRVLCWGADLQGQQGNGGSIPGPNNLEPAPISNTAGIQYERLAAGGNFMCALPKGGGQPRCWGENHVGQLGNGNQISSSLPVAVKMPGGVSAFVAIAAGDDHACALTSQGAGYCWGGNTHGQLGTSTTGARFQPVPIANGRFWTTISAGSEFTCAVQKILEDSYCWGKNSMGQLGIGNFTEWHYPEKRVTGGHTWKTIKAGGTHACGLRTDNRVLCWGDARSGQLGVDLCSPNFCLPYGLEPSPLPTDGDREWSGVDLGAEHTCAVLLSGGDVYCWGRGSEGQLGIGDLVDNRALPNRVAGNLRATNLAAGARFTVMTSVTGEVWTWGSNGNGQLGDGSVITRPSPLRILQ